MTNLLDVEHLSVGFQRYRGLLGRVWTEPVRDISLHMRPGEMVALIGASGAGKSLLAHALLGILPDNAHVHGSLRFEGQALTPARLRHLRGHDIALVPQAVTFLDPLATAARQVRWAASAAGRADAEKAAPIALARYGLRPESFGRYPHQLSGGMARRVMTAMATVAGARLLIADEPTSGLDAAVSTLALDHLRRLADEGRGVLVITHDLQAVLPRVDRLVIVHEGLAVESTTAEDFFAGRLEHAFSRALRRALPAFGFGDAAPASQASAGAGVLKARALSHRWPGAAQPLFEGLDIELAAGEWLALQGSSGCGKTTLARLLAGHIPSPRGELWTAPTPGPAHAVQWVHQHAELAFNPRRCVGDSLREGWSPESALLQRFGIEPGWLERFPHELSGGELQRLNIVRALVPGLRVLIADEMTSMHDAVTQAHLWHALRDTLAGREVGVIVISHDDALIEALGCRRFKWPGQPSA